MIYLTGESHIGCLMKAAADRPKMDTIKFGAMGPGGKLSKDIFIPHPDRVAFGNPAVRHNMKALTGTQAIMAGDAHLFGFSLGFHAFRVCQHRTWRTCAPAILAQTSGKQPLSDAVIDSLILEDNKYQRAFYDALKAIGVPCLVIESPPLQRNLPVMEKGAAPETIQYIFNRYRALTMAFMEDLGIDVIPFPEEARADDGFLRTELETEREGDVRHANAAYGAMMLDKIMAYLEAHHAHRL